jgi:hypothetical protein
MTDIITERPDPHTPNIWWSVRDGELQWSHHVRSGGTQSLQWWQPTAIGAFPPTAERVALWHALLTPEHEDGYRGAIMETIDLLGENGQQSAERAMLRADLHRLASQAKAIRADRDALIEMRKDVQNACRAAGHRGDRTYGEFITDLARRHVPVIADALRALGYVPCDDAADVLVEKLRAMNADRLTLQNAVWDVLRAHGYVWGDASALAAGLRAYETHNASLAEAWQKDARKWERVRSLLDER